MFECLIVLLRPAIHPCETGLDVQGNGIQFLCKLQLCEGFIKAPRGSEILPVLLVSDRVARIEL